MPEPQSFLARLKQRRVGQWLLAYLAGSWLLLQALDLATQNFDLAHTFFRIAVVVLAAGTLAVLVLAWFHGAKGAQRVSGLELLMLGGVLAVAAGGAAFVGMRARSDAPDAGRTPAPSVERASIAVLPFMDLSPKHDQEYFSDGLTEELLNVLAQLPALRVAARTSSFAFKGKNVDVDSIGRALHVAHVLEGSVRTQGDSVRITAQLIDARSGYHVWSDRYDRSLKQVFALQDEIAGAIAAKLRLTLGPRAAVAPARVATVDPEAHALLLKGVYFARVSKREELAQAVALLREAVRRDPAYARAHAELGSAYQRQAYLRFIPPESGYRLARSEAERALALDPRDYRGHELLGRIADYRRWDFKTAEREFGLALEINPSDAATHSHRAWMLMRLRRRDEALAAAKRATELDPVSAGMLANLAAMYLYAGQTDKATETYGTALAMEPSDAQTRASLATAYAIAGRHSEAVAAAEEARSHAADDDYVVVTNAYVYARAGRRADALRLLRPLEARRDVSPYLVAGVHLALGDTERALDLLEKAVRAHDDYPGDVAVDPVFAPLHADPRYQRLLAEAELT